MLKPILWWLYAVVVIALTVMSIRLALGQDYSVSISSAGIGGNIWILFALFGYVYNKPIIGYELWRFLFWLALVVQLPLMLGLVGVLYSGVMSFWISVMVTLFYGLLNVPAFYVLYRYGDFYHPAWNHGLFDDQLAALQQRLARESTVVLSYQDAESPSHFEVHIAAIEEGYRVDIKKRFIEQTSSFSDSLPDAQGVLRFLYRFPELRKINP
ncbi:hypothetical protein ABMA57_11130 [Saccharospirillum sp. HFRX-1]|uniref:hypothetical protein n=1 Tax=unclassified Saccharospirillum TaxID=2633430 RepID=UPI00371988F9